MSPKRQRHDDTSSIARYALIALVVGALVLAPGCSAILGGDDGGGATGPALDSVPNGVDSVAYMDVDGLSSDEELRTLANRLLQLDDDGPQTVEEAIEQAEANSTLSMENFHSVTVFGTTNATGLDDGYGAAIIRTDWTENELITAIENNSDVTMQSSTVAGKAFWTPDNESMDASYVGKLSTGTFVLGTEPAVKDSLRTKTGNLDPFSGDLRTAFEETQSDAYIRFASAIPQERVDPGEIGAGDAFNKVELVSGSHYVSDGEVGFTATMTFTDESSATSANQTIMGAVMVYRGSMAEGPTAQLLSAENFTVEQDGPALSITMENTAEGYASALEALYQQFLGFGDMTTTARTPPALA